ncbi:MAG: hypothetical protein IPH11_12915 [Ignavibacteriales bacterium]|nr:hypothetical protein [Ignavibacteriales bacterium]
MGDTLWTRTYGGVNDDYCRDIAVTDSGYILVGEKNFNLPFKPDIWIMKFNNSGDRVG